MSEKKFVFVTGPSESGKSGGVNYLENNYSDKIVHLKIRNIFPEVYKDSKSNKEYQEWYDFEYENNFEKFWNNYIAKANEMSGNKKIVIMDTMYGIKNIQYLYSILKDNLGVLYIDAGFDKRVLREYTRLRTDSTISDRKADLSITLNQVIEKTKNKDISKGKKETFEYKYLVYGSEGDIKVGDITKEKAFSYLINNDGTIEDFYKQLDEYADQLINEKYSSIKKLSK